MHDQHPDPADPDDERIHPFLPTTREFRADIKPFIEAARAEARGEMCQCPEPFFYGTEFSYFCTRCHRYNAKQKQRVIESLEAENDPDLSSVIAMLKMKPEHTS